MQLRKFVCSVCGYVHDESKGGRWEDLPEGWTCPLCGAPKAEFREEGSAKPSAAPEPAAPIDEDMRELSALEMSAVCSNLARGCEKQYKSEEAAMFLELAQYFKSAAAPAAEPDVRQLMERVEKDLEGGFPSANAAGSEAKDRGALRALVWSEKVTRILKSLLARYEREGEGMLGHTGVYVCTICGFVFVGDNPPAICPVCKVPGWKFEQVEGR